MKKYGVISFVLGLSWILPWLVVDFLYGAFTTVGGLPHLPKFSSVTMLFLFSFIVPLGLCIAAIIYSVKQFKLEKSKLAIAGLVLGIIGMLIAFGGGSLFASKFGQSFAIKAGIFDEYGLQGVCGQCATIEECNDYCGRVCEFNEKDGGYPGKLLDARGGYDTRGINFEKGYEVVVCTCTCGR